MRGARCQSQVAMIDSGVRLFDCELLVRDSEHGCALESRLFDWFQVVTRGCPRAICTPAETK